MLVVSLIDDVFGLFFLWKSGFFYISMAKLFKLVVASVSEWPDSFVMFFVHVSLHFSVRSLLMVVETIDEVYLRALLGRGEVCSIDVIQHPFGVWFEPHDFLS